MEDNYCPEMPYFSREEFGKRLEELIIDRVGNRKSFSEATGINLAHLCRIIQTGKEISLKNLDKVCRVLNTTPNYLMYGIEPRELYNMHTTESTDCYCDQVCFTFVEFVKI